MSTGVSPVVYAANGFEGAQQRDGRANEPENRRQERRRASTEAVVRRRDSRASRKQSRWNRQQERQAHDREVAVRMTRRFFPKEQIRLHWLDKRYWELRRIGYDIDSRQLRFVRLNPDGYEVVLEPTDTEQWKWWISKTFESRQHLIKIARFSVLRQAEGRYVVLHLQSGGGFCSEDERRDYESAHARN